MPELPEVQTVVDGLNRKIKGKKISSVWTDYESDFYLGKESIKDPAYFKIFSKSISGEKILKAERRAKNIQIHLSGGKTIIIHLKMTGHLLYGNYFFDNEKNTFVPQEGFISREDLKKDKTGEMEESIEKNPLRDPFNKFVHLAIVFSDKKVLVLSDMRKFASVFFKKTDGVEKYFSNIGPEPFDIKPSVFSKMAKEKKGKVKTVLMDPEFVAGIGNIYSDEILWKVGIHPDSEISSIPSFLLKEIIKFSKKILNKSISMGGDSMSDFRNIEGSRGNFQKHHNCYKLEKTVCKKDTCDGIIEKKLVGARTARFCPIHQKKF